MKILKYLILLLLITSPCYGLDLDSRHLYENILKSFDEEPENWIINTTEALYISNGKAAEVSHSSFPDVSEYCLVEINYILCKEDIYISIKKPINEYVKDPYKYQIAKKIAELLVDRLTEKYHLEKQKRPIILKDCKPQPTQTSEDNDSL